MKKRKTELEDFLEVKEKETLNEMKEQSNRNRTKKRNATGFKWLDSLLTPPRKEADDEVQCQG